MNVLAFCTAPLWEFDDRGIEGRIARGEEWHRIPDPTPGAEISAEQCESCGADEYLVQADPTEPHGIIVNCIECGYSCVVESLSEMLVVW